MSITFVVFLILSSLVNAAQSTVRLSLPGAIQHALNDSNKIKMKSEDVAFAEARLAEARAYMMPSISNLTILAPIYKDTGDPIRSTPDYNEWGPWLKTTTTIIQPIYSYGKLAYFGGAARDGIEAEKKQTDMKRQEVIYDVKQYYYGAQAAFSIMDRVEESETKLKDVIKRVDELLKAGSGEVRKQDAYKLKALLQEIKQKKEFVLKSQELATKAVAFESGFSALDHVEISDKELKKENFKPDTLSAYQKLAKDYRSEFKALEAGISARKNLVEGEKTNCLPIFFLGGLVDVADTPNDIRTRQSSPYAYDPYNGLTIGAGVGMKWNFEFTKVNAKVQQAKAEYQKLLHQKDFADKGIPLEVEKAYLEYKEAANNIAHSSEQVDQAKKWFLQSVVAWSFGVGDSREVLESVIFKGLADKNFFEATVNHNVAIASLSKATGTELLPNLKY